MMTRLFSRLTLVTLLLSPMTLAQDDLASWEQAYNQVLASDEQRALAMLQDRYNALPPSIEKLYVSSKIHGFMILRGQPYHGNQIPHQEEYSRLEQTFISALNSEEHLKFGAAKQGYLTLLRHAMETNNLNGKILFEYHLCRSLNRQGQFHKAALYCSSLNTHLDDSRHSTLPKYLALRVIANNQEYLGNYQSALKAYQEYLAIIPSHVDPSGVYNDASLLLKNLGNLPLAKEYANIALKLRSESKSELLLAQTHHSMGDILLSAQDYESAIHHFEQSRRTLVKYNHVYGLTYALLGLGKANIALQSYDVGNAFLLEALENASIQGNDQIRGDIYLTLSEAYQKQSMHIRAEDFANNALSLADAIGSAPLKGDALKSLSNIAEAQKQYQKALQYHQAYVTAEISKRDKQHQSAYLALGTAQREYIQQLQQSDLMEKNEQLADELSEYKSLFHIFASGCAALIGLLIFSSYSRKRALNVAELDAVTGAKNRASTIRDIKLLPKISDSRLKHLVILLDLDDFKQINDLYGHPTGDKALRKVAEAIKSQCTARDLFGRLGGEEFVVVMTKVDELDVADRVEQLHNSISTAYFQSESRQKLNVTASMAYLATSKPLSDFDELYSILDQALYQVKQTGKNRTIDAFNEPIYLESSAYAPVQT